MLEAAPPSTGRTGAMGTGRGSGLCPSLKLAV